MRPFLADCPNHQDPSITPLRAVFRLSRPTFSEATEPRPFWYGCEVRELKGLRGARRRAGLKELRSGEMNRDRTIRFGTPPHFSSRRLQDLRCSAADARPSRPNVQTLTNATENATTSKLAPSRAGGFVPWLLVAVPPRCPARPLSGGVRPLGQRTSAFPRFRRLRPQQQTWRPGGLEGSG
jgi:hypothetical protein